MSRNIVVLARHGTIRHLRSAAFATLVLLAAACDESPSSAAPGLCTDDEVLRLRAGQSAIIPNDVPCTLRPDENAEYALAWYDTELLTRAETEPEPYRDSEGRFVLTFIEGDGSVRYDAAQSAQVAPAPPSDARVVQGTGPARALGVEGNAGPWSANDVIRFAAPICPGGC
ncbi:hypothetical protein, partial [Longimicrobium sp.]|uniref:hypothetical protein n=1 Tax=Longimicrobium sp. TaxID=2029185 RepID=UPI002E35BE4B